MDFSDPTHSNDILSNDMHLNDDLDQEVQISRTFDSDEPLFYPFPPDLDWFQTIYSPIKFEFEPYDFGDIDTSEEIGDDVFSGGNVEYAAASESEVVLEMIRSLDTFSKASENALIPTFSESPESVFEPEIIMDENCEMDLDQ